MSLYIAAHYFDIYYAVLPLSSNYLVSAQLAPRFESMQKLIIIIIIIL